jgi:ribonuclease HI
MENHYKVYSDGAYSSARDCGGIGLVYLKKVGDEYIKIKEYGKSYMHTTNNKMELIAVITILKSFKKPIDSLEIVSDSMYVIGCATLGWTRKKNKDLWKLFDYYMNQMTCPVTFTHVKGHNNDTYNEICDKIAVSYTQTI